MRQIDQNAGFRRGHGEIKRGTQNFRLQGAITGPAKGIAHGMIDEQASGRADQGGDIPPGGNRNGGNAHVLDNARDQTHGLVIERSSRYGDQQIDAVGF